MPIPQKYPNKKKGLKSNTKLKTVCKLAIITGRRWCITLDVSVLIYQN